MTVELRAHVVDVSCDPRQQALLLTLRKGSPMPIIAHLLGLSPEEVRELDIRKTEVSFGSPEPT
jgi:hypothetical protein